MAGQLFRRPRKEPWVRAGVSHSTFSPCPRRRVAFHQSRSWRPTFPQEFPQPLWITARAGPGGVNPGRRPGALPLRGSAPASGAHRPMSSAGRRRKAFPGAETVVSAPWPPSPASNPRSRSAGRPSPVRFEGWPAGLGRPPAGLEPVGPIWPAGSRQPVDRRRPAEPSRGRRCRPFRDSGPGAPNVNRSIPPTSRRASGGPTAR